MQRLMLAGEDSRGYLVINCILAFNFEDERIIGWANSAHKEGRGFSSIPELFSHQIDPREGASQFLLI
jgi:hypothetical protein